MKQQKHIMPAGERLVFMAKQNTLAQAHNVRAIMRKDGELHAEEDRKSKEELETRNEAGSDLVIDVGGTNVKVLATGHKKRVEIPSGPKMTPAKMLAALRASTTGWKYDAVLIGHPEAGVVDGSVNFALMQPPQSVTAPKIQFPAHREQDAKKCIHENKSRSNRASC